MVWPDLRRPDPMDSLFLTKGQCLGSHSSTTRDGAVRPDLPVQYQLYDLKIGKKSLQICKCDSVGQDAGGFAFFLILWNPL